MKKTHLAFSTLFTVVVFSSCVKEPDMVPPPPVTEPVTETTTTLSSLKASESFNWSTSKKINLNFQGVTGSDHRLILKVTAPDGAVLFQKLQKANEDFTGTIEIPVHYESLTVSFGSQSKSFECKGGTATMTMTAN